MYLSTKGLTARLQMQAWYSFISMQAVFYHSKLVEWGKYYLLAKKLAGLFLHAILNGAGGHKSSTFLHNRLATNVKNIYFYVQGRHLIV